MNRSSEVSVRRRKNDGIRQRSKGTWTITVDLKRRQDGKRRQKSVTINGTRRDAEKKRRSILEARDNGTLADTPKTTVRCYIERWLSDHEPPLAAQTRKRYENLLRHQIAQRIGDLAIGNLTGSHLKDLYARLRKTGSVHGGALSSTSVRQCHSLIHAAMETAVKLSLLPLNPADRVDAPRARKVDIYALGAPALRALFEGLRGTRLFVPALLGGLCGLRRGEALAVMWDDLDTEKATLTVRRSLEQTPVGCAFKAPKSERTRVVALPGIVLEALRIHRVEQAKRRLEIGPLYRDHGLIVCYDDGRPWPPESFTPRFTSEAKRLGFARVTFHTLRHSAVSLMLSLGTHVKVVQEMAGHHSAAFTLDRYGHLTPTMQQEAAERVDAALRKATADRR